HELVAADGLGEDDVDRALVDLGVKEVHAEDDRGDHPEERHRPQAEIDGDARLLVLRPRAAADGREVHDHDHDQDGVQDLPPHRLAEGVERDGEHAPHYACTSGRVWRKNQSSSDSCWGVTETTRAWPVTLARNAVTSTSGRKTSVISSPARRSTV